MRGDPLRGLAHALKTCCVATVGGRICHRDVADDVTRLRDWLWHWYVRDTTSGVLLQIPADMYFQKGCFDDFG